MESFSGVEYALLLLSVVLPVGAAIRAIIILPAEGVVWYVSVHGVAGMHNSAKIIGGRRHVGWWARH